MVIANPQLAARYFADKVNFTTGPMELNEMIETGQEINIVDVRTPESYEKGHIPGAINLPQGSWNMLPALCNDKVNIIYSYSDTCHLAAQAAQTFSQNGYPVMELEGGFEKWEHFDFPVVSISEK